MGAVSDAIRGRAAANVVEKKVAAKLQAAQEKYDIPENYLTLMQSFFSSYMTEIYMAGRDMDLYEERLTLLMKKVLETVKTPYEFEPFHQAIREPFDYYDLGCNFAEGMVNSKFSQIVGLEQIGKMKEQLHNGDN